MDRKSIEDVTDDAVCRQVAFRVARREAGGMAATVAVAVAEELLAEEANYDFVMMLLEDVQNLVSHRLETFLSPEEVAALLGPRCRVCWRTLNDFWAAVAAWCAEALPPPQSSEQILSVRNEQLQALLWTGKRCSPVIHRSLANPEGGSTTGTSRGSGLVDGGATARWAQKLGRQAATR